MAELPPPEPLPPPTPAAPATAAQPVPWLRRRNAGVQRWIWVAAAALVAFFAYASVAVDDEDPATSAAGPDRAMSAACARLFSAADRAERGGFASNDEWQEEVESIADDAARSSDAGLRSRAERMRDAFRDLDEAAFNDAIVDMGTYCASSG